MILAYNNDIEKVFNYVKVNDETGENEFIEGTPAEIKSEYESLIRSIENGK